MRRQRAQSSVEFAASAIVLVLLLFGLIDLGRVFYYDVGLTGAVREGARQATWYDPGSATNPTLDDADIKSSVDAILTHSGLPASTLANGSGTTCPTTADGNTAYNPPYADSAYPSALDAPVLYICYWNTPGVDMTSAPADNSYRGKDVNVILVMNFGFVSGFVSGVLGLSLHIVANAHMLVGGYTSGS
jgi:Flp pilus assembly protein TadG